MPVKNAKTSVKKAKKAPVKKEPKSDRMKDLEARNRRLSVDLQSAQQEITALKEQLRFFKGHTKPRHGGLSGQRGL